MFESMVASIQEDTIKFLYGITIETREQRKERTGPVMAEKAEAGTMRDLAGDSPETASKSPSLTGGSFGSTTSGSGSVRMGGAMPKAAPKEARTGSHTPVVRKEQKIGRNDPCPCGSGKKYKNCCGKNAADEE